MGIQARRFSSLATLVFQLGRRVRQGGLWVFPCLLSAGFLGLSFPGISIWPLAWFGLVPLLWSLEDTGPWRAFFKGWMTGALFHLMTGYVTALSHPWFFMMSPLLGLSWAVFGVLYTSLKRREYPSWICCALAWTLGESLKSLGPLAFPWMPLACSQSSSVKMIQMVAWTGTIGLSCLIAGVNGWLMDLVRWIRKGKAPRRVVFLHWLDWYVIPMIILVVILGAAWILNHAGEPGDKAKAEGSIHVAIIQANIEGELRWSGDYYREAFEIYRELTLEAARCEPELIIWSECALGDTRRISWDMVPMDVLELATEIGIPILVGAPHRHRMRVIAYNSATIVSRSGRMIGRYDKMKLLPFAEAVPEGLEFLAGQQAISNGCGYFRTTVMGSNVGDGGVVAHVERGNASSHRSRRRGRWL